MFGLKCILLLTVYKCFADCLSHTPHAAVSDQSVGTAVGIVLCQTSDWNGGRNKRLDSSTLQTDTASDEVQSNAPNVNVASELQGILPTP